MLEGLHRGPGGVTEDAVGIDGGADAQNGGEPSLDI
jgi:hypothetical protein